MSIESTLRKEGIEVIKQLDTFQVNSIAQKITNKLCSAFPEQNLSRTDLFASISRLPMFLAKMSDPLCGAKYFYKNSSIYYNIDYSLSNVEDFALHECIHFLQEVKDYKGNLIRLGLYDFANNHGLAINEAAVQYMTMEALEKPIYDVKYYQLNLSTNSPECYPLECSIIRQMAYFTGTYPLYYSTLNGNDIFKNTFITITNEKVYNQIEKNLDSMLDLEEKLHMYVEMLKLDDENASHIRKINDLINYTKEKISNLFLASQNTIISNCFSKQLETIRNLDEISQFKNSIYEFQHYIATNDSYSYYNDFYRNMMESLEKKSIWIKEHGAFDFEKVLTSDITIYTKAKGAFALMKRILTRLGLLKQKEF